MHCTLCRTNYNWQTGEIITRGAFHNPHYVEWQKTHGGIGGAIVNYGDCGENMFERIQIYTLDISMVCDIYKKRFVIEFIRFMYHIFDIELYNFRNNGHGDDDCLQLRIAYLKNKISEEDFKRKLQQYEKRVEKKNEIYLVFDMLYNTGRSIVLNLVLLLPDNVMKKTIKEGSIVESIKQINALIEYTNDSMANISNKYKNKTPRIKLPKNQDIHGTFSIV
jgi:hypothetical protein